MAEQKQKKAGLTISLGRRPKVLLLGNGMNRVYGGASWAGLLEKINRTSFTADQVKSMPFPHAGGFAEPGPGGCFPPGPAAGADPMRGPSLAGGAAAASAGDAL